MPAAVNLRAAEIARAADVRVIWNAAPAVEVDPELLAQAQVQELLTSDPKRVGEILSQWARDAKVGAA